MSNANHRAEIRPQRQAIAPPNAPPPTYPDAYLDYWGVIFVATKLRDYGLKFETFLKKPERWLHHFGQESAPGCMASGFRPLLPAQAAVAGGVTMTGLSSLRFKLALLLNRT